MGSELALALAADQWLAWGALGAFAWLLAWAQMNLLFGPHFLLGGRQARQVAPTPQIIAQKRRVAPGYSAKRIVDGYLKLSAGAARTEIEAGSMEREQLLKAVSWLLREVGPVVDGAIRALSKGNGLPAAEFAGEKATTAERGGLRARSNAAAFHMYAGAFLFLHDPAAAAKAYKNSTRFDAENALSWLQLGTVSIWLGDLQQAEEALRRVIDLGETTSGPAVIAVAIANLGLVLERRGEVDKACALWREAIPLFRRVGDSAMLAQVKSWLKDAGCPDE